MKNIMILFVAAMAFGTVGCKKKGGAGEAIAKMDEFATKMCGCKDAKCAQGVTDEMTKWGAEEAKKGSKEDMKMSEDDQKKMSAATEKMTKCMTTAMGAGGDMGGSAAAPVGSGEAGSAAAPAGGSGEAGSAAAPAGGSGEAGSAAPPAGEKK
jgi:hypothetical protein